MKCAYGDGTARYIAHDKRGCKGVCMAHAFWRRYWCSRIGGGHEGICEFQTDNHLTDLGGMPADDSLLEYELPTGWNSISGCGD